MATRLPPSLYTAGAERLNSQPEVTLYANLMARRQAKREALDQYYQNLHKNINPAGMRNQDINGGWSQKVQDWEKHSIENRSRISNPRTPEDKALAIENQSMYQDILMDTQRSKEEAAKELELGKQKISGKWNPTDSDLDISERISRSIYDPLGNKEGTNQRYSLNDMSLNVPQFDPKQQEEFYKASTQGLTGAKTYDEKLSRKSNGQVFIPYEQTFTPDQIKTIGDRAANLVEGSRPAKVHYEHLMHDANFLIPANQAYQSVYGKNEMVDTPTKAAVAATIMAAQQERTKGEEIKKDEDLEFARQKALLGLKDSYAKGLHDYKHARTAGEKDGIVKRLFNDSFDAGVYDNAFLNGKQVAARKIKTLESVAKLYEKDGQYAGEKVKPTFYVTADKKYVIPRYPGETSKGQDPIPINTFLTQMGNAILTKTNNQGEVDDILDEDFDVPYVPPTTGGGKQNTSKRPPLDAFIKKNK